jgi:hypothetical protein
VVKFAKDNIELNLKSIVLILVQFKRKAFQRLSIFKKRDYFGKDRL